MAFSSGDIDAIYNALRPRLKKLLGSGTGGGTSITAHTHSADQITYEPGGYIDGDDVQEGMEELDDDKLARSGVQPMEGNLNMDDGRGPWRVYNILDLFLTGALGFARMTGIRRITMTGDDADDEARVELLDRVHFNETPTQAVVENVGHVKYQTAVNPSSHYSPEPGTASWSSVEGTLVVNVASGADVTGGTIESTVVLYSLAITDVITAVTTLTTTLYAPTVVIGAAVVYTEDIPVGSVLYAVIVGQVAVSNTITSGETLYVPTVAQV